jgi:uncharacterized membrane protein
MDSSKMSLPRWILITIVGFDMILIGGVIQWLYPFQPDDPIILIPLALIGSGMLLIFISLVSLRGVEEEGHND